MLWKNGKKVEVKIEPVYSGDSKRPDKFRIEYKIENNRSVKRSFTNAPGGKSND